MGVSNNSIMEAAIADEEDMEAEVVVVVVETT
jgi:hypothetical protein